MNSHQSGVSQQGNRIALRSGNFTFTLDKSAGLRVVSWENHLTGHRLRLGHGPELELDLDAAERRIGILGWRGIESAAGRSTPNQEPGFRAGYFQPTYDDSPWVGCLNPSELIHIWYARERRYTWARTHVFIPRDCHGQRLALVLGGTGLYDFRYLRVFVNGRVLGTRHVHERWHAPGVFPLADIRYGQDNVIALQLADPINSTARLRQLDRQALRSLPLMCLYPAQFEQYIVVGQALRTPRFVVTGWKSPRPGRVEFHLRARDAKLAARIRYEWTNREPVLRKTIQVTNTGSQAVRLLNLRLGSYATRAAVSDGEQGFPVYANDQFFFTLAHPSGWAVGQHGAVELRQYPGRTLAVGATFESMEAVYGVAAKGDARPAFLRHIRSRMRRVRRQHDQPKAIYTAYGSWPIGPDEFLGQVITEDILRDNLRKVDRGRRESGCRFDYYNIDFWADPRGDLQRAHPRHFPRGLAGVLHEIRRQDMQPGLWISSSSPHWTFNENPVISPSRACDPAYSDEKPPAILPQICRASEPARTMYTTAFCHHLRENGVRLLKFDELRGTCYNPEHTHLPGLYSTEAIQSSVIEFLQALDAAAPDVFLMLYWGYRSPWWLLHADTLFEPGLAIEASSPGLAPTLHIRDGVTQGLDQAHWFCQDVPTLGKDSLGVWLSDWRWNSGVGKERWAAGVVMDLARGNLLVQPWSDRAWLTPPERRQLAEFIALLKAQPACFANSRFILGNPWKTEPYGYACSDGQRTFLALHNCTWQDQQLPLTRTADHEVYRWYPNPARLTGQTTTMALRPFEIVLLEVAPQGAGPGLNRPFRAQPMPQRFAESTRELPLTLAPVRRKPLPLPVAGPRRVLALKGFVPETQGGGLLVITVERHRHGRARPTHFPCREFALAGRLDGRLVRAEPALKAGLSYGAAWQTWRLAIAPAPRARPFALLLTVAAAADEKLLCRAHFIPKLATPDPG